MVDHRMTFVLAMVCVLCSASGSTPATAMSYQRSSHPSA